MMLLLTRAPYVTLQTLQAKSLAKQQQQQQLSISNKEKTVTSKTNYIQNGGSPTHASTHRNNKEHVEATSPLNILNMRTVTQPRTIDKKSNFLKELKRTEHDLNASNAKQVSNAVQKLSTLYSFQHNVVNV